VILRELYPVIEPYDAGHLDVGQGHSVYYERVGTEGAKPAVFLHGGPGGGLSPKQRQIFDPHHYDVLLFEQRGCGRSTPHASLAHNRTWDLVADIERFRTFFGVEQWTVVGGSWGSTLALAYAQTHPDRVSELVLRGIFLGTKAESDWFYQFGVSEIFPDKWSRFASLIPESERHDLLAAYHRRLTQGSLDEQLAAARAWSIYECETITLLPDAELASKHVDPYFALAFARLETHYFVNRCWLEPNQLLRDAARISNIPGTIVHGRYDAPCPLRMAYMLHQAWPNSVLHIAEGAGHSLFEPTIFDRVIRALDHYAGNLEP
jgi:proline iminopeptidase